MSDETTLSAPASRGTGTRSSRPANGRAVGNRGVARPVPHRGWRELGDREGSQARSLSALDQRLQGAAFESDDDTREYLEGFLAGWFRARAPDVRPDSWEYWAIYHYYNDKIAAQARDRFPFASPPRAALESLDAYVTEIAATERRQAELSAIAHESGLTVADVERIIRQYEIALHPAPRHPGVIDPRGVVFLNTPMQQTARYIAPFLPYAGVIQAFYGIED